MHLPLNVRIAFDSGHGADVRERQKSARNGHSATRVAKKCALPGEQGVSSESRSVEWLRIRLDGRKNRPRRPSPAVDYSQDWRESTFFKEGLRACTLPRDLFMKKLENMGQTILEQPCIRELDFRALTCGAPPDDQQLVLRIDEIARAHPEKMNGIKSESHDTTSFLPPVIAAQNQTASVLERNLDDLQLRLLRLWPLSSIKVGISPRDALKAKLAAQSGS